jgi:hypothetical protein
VGVAVAVSPAGVVGVVTGLVGNLIEKPPQILQAAVLKFNRGEGGGGGWAKNRHRSVLQAGVAHQLRHAVGDVVRICVALRVQVDGVGGYAHRRHSRIKRSLS